MDSSSETFQPLIVKLQKLQRVLATWDCEMQRFVFVRDTLRTLGFIFYVTMVGVYVNDLDIDTNILKEFVIFDSNNLTIMIFRAFPFSTFIVFLRILPSLHSYRIFKIDLEDVIILGFFIVDVVIVFNTVHILLFSHQNFKLLLNQSAMDNWFGVFHLVEFVIINMFYSAFENSVENWHDL